MGLWWIAVLVVLVLVVSLIVRWSGGASARGDESPEQVLKRRYAKGEVDREESQRRLEDLRR